MNKGKTTNAEVKSNITVKYAHVKYNSIEEYNTAMKAKAEETKKEQKK